MLIEFGVTSAKEWFQDPETDEDKMIHRVLPGLRVCEVIVPEGTSLLDTLLTITHEDRGVIVHQSADTPAWVDCPERPVIAQLLAEHYGCSVGKPENVEETHWTKSGPPTVVENPDAD